MELNCDGAYKKVQDVAECNDLLRNSDDCWIQGYTQKIGSCDALNAEILGMYIGLKFAERQGVTQLIIVESDSKVLIDVVKGSCNLNGATPILIRRIQYVINRN
ncbi:receptor-like kinase [Trifolium medium]|uniref:Receptor-like kinase n=1 Tax=Trifolium medium TaxID=97028 RepID=A0A392LZ93_9FABA|nr:receptor-like kinase [Trifolium medium]